MELVAVAGSACKASKINRFLSGRHIQVDLIRMSEHGELVVVVLCLCWCSSGVRNCVD